MTPKPPKTAKSDMDALPLHPHILHTQQTTHHHAPCAAAAAAAAALHIAARQRSRGSYRCCQIVGTALGSAIKNLRQYTFIGCQPDL